MWPFDWPRKAARRDVRKRKYKPPMKPMRFVFALSYTAAVGALQRADPSNGLISPFVSVPPFLL
jgi:hypothetical protein